MTYDSTKPLDTLAPEKIRENFRALKEDGIVNAGSLSGYSLGNNSGNIPVSNGVLCTNLNADLLDGHDTNYFTDLMDSKIAAAIAGIGINPCGHVAYFAMSTAPDGYLKANGAAVSRTTYSALFSVIGTTFGSGDGSTTFNLPDLRGFFVRGWADDGSIDSGRTFGSTQASTNSGYAVTNRNGASCWKPDGSGYVESTALNINSVDTTNNTETRPVNSALLACIKY